DEGVQLLIRRPTPLTGAIAAPTTGRTARPLNDEPARIYVPLLMRPWVMKGCHTDLSCHLDVTSILALLERFYWWVGMEISTRFWIRRCFKMPSP
ncbi:unnamed protein product, partial [Sphacelaria rigidula]